MNRIDCFAFTVSYIFRQKKWTVYRQKYPVMFVSINKMELSESWSNPHKSWWMALGFMSATDRMNKKSDSKKKINIRNCKSIYSIFFLVDFIYTMCVKVYSFMDVWFYMISHSSTINQNQHLYKKKSSLL